MHLRFKYTEIHTNTAHNALIKLAKNNLLPLCYTGKKKKSNLSTEELKKLHVSFT